MPTKAVQTLLKGIYSVRLDNLVWNLAYAGAHQEFDHLCRMLRQALDEARAEVLLQT